jgi:hypothetical protein
VRLRSIVPVLALALVAANQIRLARTTPLSSWKGGGFGMFATNDSPGSRRLRIVVHAAAGGGREIEVPARLTKLAAKTVIFPDAARLRRLAVAVVAEERRQGGAVERVELEVWRREYATLTLFSTETRLARHDHREPAASGDAG